MAMRRAALLLAAALALPAAAHARGADGRFEQRELDELERAYDQLDQWLGLRPRRKIEVVVYDPAAFDAAFAGAFRFPAAGFYQGVIRVRGDVQLTGRLSRVLHHELVHAALDAAAPTLWLPGWVNEGSAEWFEARTGGQRGLRMDQRAVLADLAQHGELLGLTALAHPTFAGLPQRAAQVAYLESYALIEYLARQRGERSLANFLDALIQSRSLDRALRRVYRIDTAELEERFLAEVD